MKILVMMATTMIMLPSYSISLTKHFTMVAMVMITTMIMMVTPMTHPLLLSFEGAATIVIDNQIRSQVHADCSSLTDGFYFYNDEGDYNDEDDDEYNDQNDDSENNDNKNDDDGYGDNDDDLLYLNSGPVTAPQAVPGKSARGRCSSTFMMMIMTVMMMVMVMVMTVITAMTVMAVMDMVQEGTARLPS